MIKIGEGFFRRPTKQFTNKVPMKLVVNKNKTMSSLEIAKLTEKEHSNVMRDIRKILNEVNIDQFIFESIFLDSYNREQPCFNLPRRECDLVISGYSAKYRLAIIDRWQELENKETERLQGIQDRSELRLEFRPMTDAIVDSRDGKEIKHYHFSNECDLINRIALGCTSKQYRDYNDIPKNDPIRDHLTPEQKKCVLALQRANTVYLLEGEDFDKRKKRLSSLYERQHARPLLEELIRLEA